MNLKNKHIFRVGIDAGFFSEYNNMILAYLYCREHGIRFSLYSGKANFGFSKGWEDYFLPFCEQTEDPIHGHINVRGHHRLNKKDKQSYYSFKLRNFRTTLTQDLWFRYRDPSFAKKRFGKERTDLQTACGQLVDETWKFNPEVRREIDQILTGLQLPEHYLGIHIRGGDKFIEAPLMEVNRYIEKAESHSSLTDVFILTDDYRIIESVKELRPQWNIFTLCEPEERGYFHEQFEKVDLARRRHDHIKLFSSIEALASSDKFIGTYTSNPGMYLGMRMGKERCFGIDSDHWLLMW